MNLYAIAPCHAPTQGPDLVFGLYDNDEQALKAAVFYAAHDAVNEYGSPRAEVFRVVTGVEFIGSAHATDAPQAWDWAHPGVEENALQHVCTEIEFGDGSDVA